MSKRNRIEYLLVTACVFLSGSILYGFLASMHPLINGDKVLSFLAFGCLGGCGFSMVVATIILSARFFPKRSLSFKIISAVLWPITFACCVYVGVVMYIPYGIYNIVMLLKKDPQAPVTAPDILEE